MPATFHLLHLSDLHIGAQSITFSCSDPSIWFEVARTAYHLRIHLESKGHQLDAIVITGDLADTGTWKDINLAREFVSSPARQSSWLNYRGRPTLTCAQSLILALPGNHDRFKSVLGGPACRNFDVAFGPVRPWSGVLGGLHAEVLGSKNGSRLGLVCADFTLLKRRHASIPGGHVGQGKVYLDRLQELVEFTQWLRAHPDYSNPAVIWLAHFPPEFPVPNRWLELVDEKRLLTTAAAVGVRHILCGHRHLSRCYHPGSTPQVRVYSAGTATCLKPNEDTMIHVLRITVETNQVSAIDIMDLRWDTHQGRFDDAKP